MIKFIPYLFLTLFISGILFPIFHNKLKTKLAFLLSSLPLAIFLILLYQIQNISPEYFTLIKSSFNLLLGVGFDFRFDGLSITFGLLISAIGFLIMLYAGHYMSKYERQGHFFTYLTLFMAAMVSMVFSDNLLILFVFWELTSVISFLLIGFEHEHEKSRQAALQSLLITGFGGLCLLFAVVMLGQILGTYSISTIISSDLTLIDHPSYRLVFGLILLAVFTKSAQFPFHFWLPGAMQAPTPVSAYLHSATMVNAGVFLLMRIHPVFGGTLEWKYSLVLVGATTMFIGAFFSMGQKDLKRILAFTTISALGTMVMLIGSDSPLTMKAALVFFIVHALYKGGLFMVAGIIDKSTGTRDISLLSKLGKTLPLTSIAAILALISMAGLPPMLGFISKELVYDSKLQLPGMGWLLLPLVIGANIIMIAISLTIYFEIFNPKSKKEPIKAKYKESDFPWYFIAGPIMLAFAGLSLGLKPGILDHLVANGLYAIKSELYDVHFSLWHGFNDALLLSIITVLAGIVVFLYRRGITRFFTHLIDWLNNYHLPTIFMQVMNNYLHFSALNTKRLQHGYHRFYLITFFLTTGILIAYIIDWKSIMSINYDMTETSHKAAILVLLLIAVFALLYAVFSSSRLSAIVALGVVGYVIGLIYLLFGAVDLAITQLLTETVIMILFVMVIYYLPNFMVYSKRTTRLRDFSISIIIGVMVFFVVLNARFINMFEPISNYFVENSLTQAHGRNIVNVILVDFRALDTLGEITVLALAAVGVYSLYKFKVPKQQH